jgi:hypothetical protein
MKSSPKQNFIAAALIVLLAMAAGSLVGCASYTFQPVPPAGSNSWGGATNHDGYVFYEPELYFFGDDCPGSSFQAGRGPGIECDSSLSAKS